MKAIDTNPWLEEVRKAYHASRAYEILHGGGRVNGTVGAALPKAPEPSRTPGEDREDLPLGIARDPIETEFMEAQADRAEP